MDLVVFVVDGKAGVGRGDRFVADEVEDRRDICVLNKVDGVSRVAVMRQLKELAEWGFDEYFAVSARTGAGVEDLVNALVSRVPEGPAAPTLTRLPRTKLAGQRERQTSRSGLPSLSVSSF